VAAAETVLAWTDLAAAARRNAVRSWVWAALVPLCLFFMAMAAVFSGVGPRIVAALLIVFAGGIPLWGPTAATRVQARRRPLPSHPTKWTATSSGLVIEREVGQSTLPWSDLTGATSWKRGVSLSYGRSVVFIPSRAFPTAEERGAFVAAAEANLMDRRR